MPFREYIGLPENLPDRNLHQNLLPVLHLLLSPLLRRNGFQEGEATAFLVSTQNITESCSGSSLTCPTELLEQPQEQLKREYPSYELLVPC